MRIIIIHLIPVNLLMRMILVDGRIRASGDWIASACGRAGMGGVSERLQAYRLYLHLGCQFKHDPNQGCGNTSLPVSV